MFVEYVDIFHILSWFIIEKQMKYSMSNKADKRTFKTKQYKQN